MVQVYIFLMNKMSALRDVTVKDYSFIQTATDGKRKMVPLIFGVELQPYAHHIFICVPVGIILSPMAAMVVECLCNGSIL